MFSLLSYAALIVFIDQSSKSAVQTHVTGEVWWGRAIQIRQIHHYRLLYQQRAGRGTLLSIWAAAFVSAIWLHAAGLGLQSRLAMPGVGCALGGAAGNLIDILRRRHIVNFIDLGWWPVFNLADVAIIAGLALAFWP
jgi:signal peptidase II